MGSTTTQSGGGVPPGFRFHPTDEELLHFYLKKKICFEKFDMEVIREVDLNKIEPWELQERCKIGLTPQNEWYFFSHKDRKYPTGSRTNRATSAGFWKATGRDKCIRNSNSKIGMRKTLVFYRGRAPHGQKTDWIMHEYRLEDSDHDHQSSHHHEDGWVVCRVFKKKNLFKVIGSSGNPNGGEGASNHNNNNINNGLMMMTTTSSCDHQPNEYRSSFTQVGLSCNNVASLNNQYFMHPHDQAATDINNYSDHAIIPHQLYPSQNFNHAMVKQLMFTNAFGRHHHLPSLPSSTDNYEAQQSPASMQVKQFMSDTIREDCAESASPAANYNNNNNHSSETTGVECDRSSHVAVANIEEDHQNQLKDWGRFVSSHHQGTSSTSPINQISRSIRSKMDFWAYGK